MSASHADHHLPDACRAILDDVLDVVMDPEGLGLPAAVDEHVGACAPCAERLRRMRDQVGALAGLDRVAVPSELDGRVVAALQAGHRQDRATTALASLERLAAPDELVAGELDLAAWAQPVDRATRLPGERHPAPSVLDRLVDESLRDLPRSVSRGLLDRLPRRKAPAELDARVEAEITASRSGRLGRWTRLAMAVPAGLAAAAVLFLTLSPMMGSGAGDPPTPDYPFQVVRRDAFDADQHSTGTVQMLETITGQPLRKRL